MDLGARTYWLRPRAAAPPPPSNNPHLQPPGPIAGKSRRACQGARRNEDTSTKQRVARGVTAAYGTQEAASCSCELGQGCDVGSLTSAAAKAAAVRVPPYPLLTGCPQPPSSGGCG